MVPLFINYYLGRDDYQVLPLFVVEYPSVQYQGLFDRGDREFVGITLLLVSKPFLVDEDHLLSHVLRVNRLDRVVDMLPCLVQVRYVIDRGQLSHHLLRVIQCEMKQNLHRVEILNHQLDLLLGGLDFDAQHGLVLVC